MSALTRRGFVRIAPVAALLLAPLARADDPVLAETDPEAIAANYRSDAANVDRAKFPTYVVGQTCANCGLFAPDGVKPTGGCQLFYGKDVAAKGWCSAWEKK